MSGSLLRRLVSAFLVHAVSAQQQTAGLLGNLDPFLPEQAPEVPSTSLIMLFIVAAMLLGEISWNIYSWFDRHFGDRESKEEAEAES